MIVIRQRNKEIEDVILKNLIRCHIFKVRPENPESKAIVVETLKAFTVIMMEEAKGLMKRIPYSIFKLTNQQRLAHSPLIDRLFGIVYCLPDQCLNQLKISKEPKEQIEEEEWESEK